MEDQPRGNCFQNSIEMMLEHGMVDAFLVHGLPVLTKGPLKGERYGHAWIELGTGLLVLHPMPDGKFIGVQKLTYYDAGRIDESQVTRYTLDEVHKKMNSSEHFGPWEDKYNLNTYDPIKKSQYKSRKKRSR